jgi:hypothetical protein
VIAAAAAAQIPAVQNHKIRLPFESSFSLSLSLSLFFRLLRLLQQPASQPLLWPACLLRLQAVARGPIFLHPTNKLQPITACCFFVHKIYFLKIKIK